MSQREGSGWSRTWGSVALLAFGLHLGASLYDVVVVFPLWSGDLPKSVTAWATMDARPDPSRLFTPLVVAIVFASAMAWISALTTRGWRRGWLTLALVAACGVAAVTVTQVMPVERELFGPAAFADGDRALLVGLVGDWMRVSAMRLAVLAAGAWLAWRAQLAGSAAWPVRGAGPAHDDGPALRRGARRPRDFSLGDLAEPEITLGDETGNARQRWQRSLPPRRRTAKK